MPDAPGLAALAALGTWGFIGAGALGASFARALGARGASIVAVSARQPERAAQLAASLPACIFYASPASAVLACDVIVLAVPDDAIAALDASLPWRSAQLVIHLSGARGLTALRRAASAGAHVAAMHPLMIFPRPEPSGESALARFGGCTWAVESSDAAAAAVSTIVAALDGRVVSLQPEHRIPYHLAAVLASNYVVTLLGTAIAVWRDLGLEPGVAREALLPLLRATVDRLATQVPAEALAGPVARGDIGTVSAHLAWLRERGAANNPPTFDPATLRAAYVALAELTVPLALERGSLALDVAQTLQALLRQASDAEQRPSAPP